MITHQAEIFQGKLSTIVYLYTMYIIQIRMRVKTLSDQRHTNILRVKHGLRRELVNNISLISNLISLLLFLSILFSYGLFVYCCNFNLFYLFLIVKRFEVLA